MLFRKNISRIALAMAALALSVSVLYATSSNFDYRFKVHNKSDSKIVKLWASPDGKKYGSFDIGAGIAAGSTMELVWDKSTDNGNCEWYLKATFADGEDAPPAKFDFCEKDLVVEFN